MVQCRLPLAGLDCACLFDLVRGRSNFLGLEGNDQVLGSVFKSLGTEAGQVLKLAPTWDADTAGRGKTC